MRMRRLTHVDESGHADMVDVSRKASTARTSTAIGFVRCDRDTIEIVRSGQNPKGSLAAVAELAGVMAAKRTSELIPLCHPLCLTKVDVGIEMDEDLPGFHVQSTVATQGVTGVEMEALTAVSIACLTLFDMLKAVDRTMVIGGIEVRSKSGGRSGNWHKHDQL